MTARQMLVPDNDNNKGAAMLGEPPEVKTRGLVLTWQRFEGERLLILSVDMGAFPFFYALEAYRYNNLIASIRHLDWSDVDVMMRELCHERGEAPTLELFNATVRRIAFEGGDMHES